MESSFKTEGGRHAKPCCGLATMGGRCQDPSCGIYVSQLFAGRWCADCAPKHNLKPIIIRQDACEEVDSAAGTPLPGR